MKNRHAPATPIHAMLHLLLAAATFTLAPACLAQSTPAATQETPAQEAPADDSAKVVVRAPRQITPVAPAWQQGRNYKFGDFVSYDGTVYKAKNGSNHRRPDRTMEIGWEKMNDCDDKSKGAIKCELGNQAETIPTAETERKLDDNVRAIEFNTGASMRN